MTKQFKKYKKEALDALDVGDKIWSEAIDRFQLTSIETSAFVLELSQVDEKLLAKNFGLGQGKIGAWAKPNRHKEAEVLESNSRDVVKFVVEKLNEVFEIEEKTLSFRERLDAHRAAKNSL